MIQGEIAVRALPKDLQVAWNLLDSEDHMSRVEVFFILCCVLLVLFSRKICCLRFINTIHTIYLIPSGLLVLSFQVEKKQLTFFSEFCSVWFIHWWAHVFIRNEVPVYSRVRAERNLSPCCRWRLHPTAHLGSGGARGWAWTFGSVQKV